MFLPFFLSFTSLDGDGDLLWKADLAWSLLRHGVKAPCPVWGSNLLLWGRSAHISCLYNFLALCNSINLSFLILTNVLHFFYLFATSFERISYILKLFLKLILYMPKCHHGIKLTLTVQIYFMMLISSTFDHWPSSPTREHLINLTEYMLVNTNEILVMQEHLSDQPSNHLSSCWFTEKKALISTVRDQRDADIMECLVCLTEAIEYVRCDKLMTYY